MPYITKQHRLDMAAGFPRDASPGQLNYQLTQLCLAYEGNPGGYQVYNDIIGALECCKLEFYARAVRPYEDKKIEENGDVYV